VSTRKNNNNTHLERAAPYTRQVSYSVVVDDSTQRVLILKRSAEGKPLVAMAVSDGRRYLIDSDERLRIVSKEYGTAEEATAAANEYLDNLIS
jgi:hypothetical protein